MALSATQVLNDIQKLAPVWAERAATADTLGHIAPETAGELQDIGAYRLLQPARFGGGAATIEAHVRAVAAAAEGCASTAWCLAVWSVHNWMLALFDPEAQDEIWGADPAARISASIVPRARFEPAATAGHDGATDDDAIIVAGRYPFASGCDHASWFGLGGLLRDEQGGDQRSIAMIPASDAVIDHSSWAVMGLRATGSKDLVVGPEVRVPRHRVLATAAAVHGAAPGQLATDETLYCAPFRAVAALVLAPPALGVARAALARFIERAAGHRVGMSGVVQRHDPAAGLRVAESSAEIDAAELVMIDAARRIDALARARSQPSAQQTATILRDTAYSVRLCAGAVDRLYEASGGSSLSMHEPMQRYWRDVHAARSHTVLTWDNAANEYAAAALAAD